MQKSISAYLAEIGRRGGKRCGPAKARTKKQARAAALARWKDYEKIRRK
jgi:hypothetical protein